MPDHDVVVAGGGPVGLLLGCLLAQRGIDVAVCERRVGPDPRTRAIGIHPPGLAALHAAGAGEAVRAEALALAGGEVRSRGRTLAAVTFGPRRPVLTLPQHRTDATLRDRLAALGAALRAGCVVTAAVDDGRSLRVRTDDRGVEDELAASFLVAADGVRSALRTAAGIGWRRVPGDAGYVMVDVPDAAPDAVARLHCEPAGLVESFPLPGGMRRWVLRGDGSAATSAAEFQDEIAARLGMAPEIPPGIRPVSFRARQHRAERMVEGRLVLVGDAAREISPIGGQGMNLGWADAIRLAEALARALRAGGDLGAYERRTHRSAAAAQRRSAFYMAMGAPASGPSVAVREGLIRLLGSAPLRTRTTALITMRGA